MTAYLRSSDYIRLTLNRASTEQSGPVRFTGANGEGGWIGDDVSALAAEGD